MFDLNELPILLAAREKQLLPSLRAAAADASLRRASHSPSTSSAAAAGPPFSDGGSVAKFDFARDATDRVVIVAPDERCDPEMVSLLDTPSTHKSETPYSTKLSFQNREPKKCGDRDVSDTPGATPSRSVSLEPSLHEEGSSKEPKRALTKDFFNRAIRPEQKEACGSADGASGDNVEDTETVDLLADGSESHTHAIPFSDVVAELNQQARTALLREELDKSSFPNLSHCEEDVTTSSFTSKSEVTIELFKDAEKPSENSTTTRLALGSIFRTAALDVELEQVNDHTPLSSSKLQSPGIRTPKPDPFGLVLGRSSLDLVSASKQPADSCPFWQGLLYSERFRPTRAVAHCLGDMKPESRLGKLREILHVRKIVKIKEFWESFRLGLMEPVIQLTSSPDASIGEVQSFNSMVEALSGESSLRNGDHQLELELGRQSPPGGMALTSSAAVILLEEDAEEDRQVEVYLITPPSFNALLETWLPRKSICALEEVDADNSVALYGFLCQSGVKSRPRVFDLFNKDKLDALSQKVLRPSDLAERGLLVDLGSTENIVEEIRDGDGKRSTDSCLMSISDVEQGKVATRCSPKKNFMDQTQASPDVDAGNSGKDIEDGGEDCSLSAEVESSKRLHGHSSLSERKHDVKGKKHIRHSNHSDVASDEDIYGHTTHARERERGSGKSKSKDHSRHLQRHDWQSEKIKERDTYWWSKEHKDSERHRGKEHQKDSLCDNEKDKKSRDKSKESDREEIWDGDIRETEWSPRELLDKQDKMTEKVKSKLGTDQLKVSLPSSQDEKSLVGQHLGKESKKREREDGKEAGSCIKRLRQTKSVLDCEPDILIEDGKYEGKVNSQVEDMREIGKEDKGCSQKMLEDSSMKSKDVEGVFHPGWKDGDDRLPMKDPEGVNKRELDAKVGNQFTTDFTPLKVQKFEDKSAEKGEEKAQVDELRMEGMDILNSENEFLSIPIYKAGDYTERVALRVDDPADFPLTKVGENEAGCEFLLDGFDKETRTWLISKQSAHYLEEEYGVNAIIQGEIPNSNSCSKVESQQGLLHVKISMPISDNCDVTEAKWFVNQAVDVVRHVALRGVFVKCLWYEGPVQLQAGDGAPSVSAVVKKIKGDDGKSLERIQDATGVMIGVVLRKGVVEAGYDLNPIPRFIGLRLKCVRRKGLVEASKRAEALILYVADYFCKELASITGDPQESGIHNSEICLNASSPPHASTAVAKEFLATSPATAAEPCTGDLALPAQDICDNIVPLPMHEEPGHNLIRAASSSLDDEPEFGLYPDFRGESSRPLYVSNLPENASPMKLRNIFESVLKEKLVLPASLERNANLVVDVRYVPDKFCAFVEFATDSLLKAVLKLYAEDKMVFRGLKVELGLGASSKLERPSVNFRGEVRNRGFSTDSNPDQANFSKTVLGKRTKDEAGRRFVGVSCSESDSDYSCDRWFDDHDASLRTDIVVDKPKPLFITELMRNASAQSIKQLFEEVIKKYISSSLVSSHGRQLVLDVRYVPSRGCAFVDLATPELVEFMLDLHSRRPEVFHHMRMELGRRPVPTAIEDVPERRTNLHNRDILCGKSRNYGLISGHLYEHHRSLAPSVSRRQTERGSDVSYRDYDYFEESDKGDDLSRQMGGKKHRSDPEKTVYADRLPDNASESMIKRIFEQVLYQHMTQEQRDVLGDHIITEVRHVPIKYCAFIVFAAEELTRLVLHLYNQDEDIFERMRLKPHFHSRMEDLYREDFQEREDGGHLESARDRMSDHRGHYEGEDFQKSHVELYDTHGRAAAVHRAINATAFKEVDRRRSVYVDRIPERLSEAAMREMFEKVFRRKSKRHGHDPHMVSQVTFFRDKFDPNKLCAFVEVRNEDATQDLIDCYNANEDAFHGMRVRPALKYNS